MKLLSRLPPRQMEGADEVLEGSVWELTSGNHARVWPIIKYDAEANESRIAFFFEFRETATPDDTAEVMAELDALMGKKPTTYVEGTGDPFADPRNIEWLRTGKSPKPRKPQ